MDEPQLRAQMCKFGRMLWDRDLVGAAEGNLSARLGDGRILCTPSGRQKGSLAPEDMVVIDDSGVSLSGGLPSSEIKLHLGLFRARPDCQSVIHAHPPVATAMALAGVTIPDGLMPEAMIVLGSVVLVDFAMPGTEAVPASLAPYAANHKTFLLSHHGAATIGLSIEDAYNRMETLERVARAFFAAKLMGGAVPLPADSQVALQKMVTGDLT